MSKRTADDHSDAPLKGGERPEQMDVDMDKDMGEFEDEFEDEFESEDEIIEAGVDGRPDAEREAEEKERECLCSSALPPFCAHRKAAQERSIGAYN